MTTAADSGTAPENPLARIPPTAGKEIQDEIKRWVDYAAGQVVALQQGIDSAIDSTVIAAHSGLSHLRSVSSAGLSEAKGAVGEIKNQYAAYEDVAVGKIKEGILVAAANPGLSCGIAAGVGLVVFKSPRRFLIQNTRRIFVSEETLLSDAEAKVNQLRQSIDLVKNESKKLEERAFKAEKEMEHGRMELIKEGRAIQGELNYVRRIESQVTGIKQFLRELSRTEAYRCNKEVNALASQVKKEKKALSRTASRIINNGIPL